MTITIREALQLPDMVQSKLVGGAAGLDTPIRWVTIVEVLEDTTRLQEGEFLITTGYGLMNDVERLAAFIPSLARRKLSGVAIHTGFYMGEIPEILINDANKHGLPLIEIPVEVNFSTITKAILQPIINRQFETLAYSQAIHEQMIAVALSGQGLPAIARELARLTQGSVKIVDLFGYHLVTTEEQEQAAERHVAKPQEEPQTSGAPMTGTATGSMNNVAAKAAPLSVLRDRHSESVTVEADGQGMTILSVPIQTTTERYGFLSLKKPDAAWQELDQIALQHAATLCAMEFIKERAIRETEWRTQGDFADEILAGRVSGSAEEEARSRLLGYPLQGSHFVVALRPAASGQDAAEPLPYQLTALLNRLAHQLQTPYLQRERSQYLLLIMPERKASLTLLERLARRWNSLDPTHALHIGVSRPRQHLPELAEAADEAAFALHAYPLLGQPPQPLPFTQMEGYQVLLPFSRHPAMLAQLWQPLLGTLLNYDQKYNQQLLETLQVYLLNNGNGLQTAQALFIHRHTLTYRLRQIADKTGIDLQHAGSRWQLQLALMAYRLHKLLYPDTT